MTEGFFKRFAKVSRKATDSYASSSASSGAFLITLRRP